MGQITEISQNKRLREYGINIKTKYQTEQGVRERNTDHSLNQNVEKGIRIEKRYYRNGAVIHKNKRFDSRILYTFVTEQGDGDVFVCPNCGGVSRMTDVDEGCPYCGNYLNLDYSHKNLGSKNTYDQTLKNRNYIWITLLVDLLFSILVSFLYIRITGRTFNGYDIAKVTVLGIGLCAAFFYVFYYLDALIVLLPIRRYKEKINQSQIQFWKRMEEKGIQKEKFYNNFNYELGQYYFEQKEKVIDYDILDYNSLEEFYENSLLCVRVSVNIRIVSYDPSLKKIEEETGNREYILQYQGAADLHLEGGVNQIRCRNCGASIDATVEECPYCGMEYRSIQEWILKMNE